MTRSEQTRDVGSFGGYKRGRWFSKIVAGTLFCGLVLPGTVSGVITVTGDLNPVYDASDPWILSGDLHIGASAAGTLLIDDGSGVSNAKGNIGTAGYDATVTVSGTGSTWDNADTLSVGVGLFGSSIATLNIEDGGTVNSPSSHISSGFTSTTIINVVGNGSTWNNPGELIVGNQLSSSSVLHIANGGTVNSGDAQVAGSSNAGSGVVVTGTGTTWNSTGSLNVGDFGNRGLLIAQGGVVNIAEDTWIASSTSNELGAIELDNGTLNTTGLAASPGQLLGTGTINTRTLLSDIDLVFDATYGVQQQVVLNSLPDQNVTINLDVSDHPDNLYALGAGYRDTGTMNVTDGVSVYSYEGFLGYRPQSNGIATISGPGSAWHVTDDLEIGLNGNGTINIENGATVSAEFGVLGISTHSDASGVINVRGTGSTWNSYGLGIHNGELNIENGASVISHVADVGRAFFPDYDETATVTVSGPGSTWENTLTVWLGDNVPGTLNIESGGRVSVATGIIFASNNTGHGTINLNGGTLDLNGSDISHGNGTVEFNFTDGILVDAGTIDLGHALAQDGGTLAPGGSIGTTNIVGDYTLNKGKLEVEFGGAGNPHDLLTVTGDIDIALLGTTLDLSALGPMEAGTYTIVESTGGVVNGMFEHIKGLDLNHEIFDVWYDTNAVRITLTSDSVPEPGVVTLLGSGGVLLLMLRTRPTPTHRRPRYHAIRRLRRDV